MENQSLTLNYDLFSLPTAQHKAGLAGLLLMIKSMEEREISPLPEVKNITPNSVSIEFTKENLQTVFNDLYDASLVENEYKVKRKKKNKEVIEPKKIIEKVISLEKGKEKRQTFFIYEDVQPKGAFLSVLYEEKEAWIKLWRDMIWNIMRVKPTTRGDYQRRAIGETLTISNEIWDALLVAEKNRKDGKAKAKDIAGAIFIGAQMKNAEKVSFQGITEQNLLLHFWQLSSLVYVPQKITIEGGKENSGYVVVIPEPSNLENFIEDVVLLMKNLGEEIYYNRPKDALIDLPEEGGLEYLYNLTYAKIKEKEVSYNLTAVELYHMERRGDSSHMLAAERIVPDKHIIDNYNNHRKTFFNPFYKFISIKNLLSGDLWFTGFQDIFSRYPVRFFVYKKGKTPYKIPFFGHDVKKKFKSIENIKLDKGGLNNMTDKEREELLSQRIYRLIRTYVNHKTKEKSGMTYEDFKKNYSDKYRESREKICLDAFLAMRGRREQDFIEYFTGTICSVPQFLPESDYLDVANALINEWEKVKTLSMLSVSACSYLSEPKDNTTKEV